MNNRYGVVRGVLAVGILVAASATGFGLLGAGPTQDPPPEQRGSGGMPDLPEGIRNTPGCLGVEMGQMASGKQSIFAWFENKAAVKRWYYSDMHQGVMKMAAGLSYDTGPLDMVDDDEGPILVIATLTMSDKPHFDEIPGMPISQISIELYKPLPGGAYLGARLAPDTVKVENMRSLAPAEGGD